MNIPQTAIEPFGYTGVPELQIMIEPDQNPELLRIFAAIKATFKDVTNRWRVIHHAKKRGIELPEYDEDIIKMRTVFAGGTEVTCKYIDYDKRVFGNNGFYLAISFEFNGERYGDLMEHVE